MKKGTRKNLVSTLVTVLIIAGGVFAFQGLSSQKKSTVSDKAVKKERRKVQWSTFKATNAENTIEIDGRLRSVESINISSKVGGVLESTGTTLRKGTFVKKGTPLFTIDATEAVYNLKAAKSSLMTTITQMMPDLKFDYPDAFQGWQDYLRNFDVNRAIQSFPEPTTDQERYYVAGRNIYNQYYAIKSQETRIADYTIYAPFSGILTQVNVFPGGLVTPNASLATMINTSSYEIEAPVSLEQLKYVKLGQSVKLSSKDLDKSWTGKVSRIGTQIDNTTQNLPIFISVFGRGLKDGMYLTGSLTGSTLKDVISLPKDIFISPQKIYTIVDSTLVIKEVNSVKRLSDQVLINGLDPEEKVVVGSLSGLFEGQKVTY